MGTSSPVGGPQHLLVPDFVRDEEAAGSSDGELQTTDASTDEVGAEPASGPNETKAEELTAAAAGSLPPISIARGNFTRAASGGDGRANSRAVGRALKGYVRSAGGGTQAARRMSRSVGTAAGVAGFANTYATQGPAAALAQFNLQDMAGRPAVDVMQALADVLCPEGGTIDDAVAREAMLEALFEFDRTEPGSFDTLTVEQLGVFLCNVIARSIGTKVLNDIGTNALHASASDADFREAEKILRDYVDGRIRDAFSGRMDLSTRMSPSQIATTSSDVFADAFEMLGAILDQMR